MCGRKDLFIKLESIAPYEIGLPNGSTAIVVKTGSVCLYLSIILHTCYIFHNFVAILYVFLNSCGKIIVLFFYIEFDLCVVQDRTSRTPIRVGKLQNGIYFYRLVPSHFVGTASVSMSTDLWHVRLDIHLFLWLKEFIRQNSLGFVSSSSYEYSDVCLHAKQTWDIFPDSLNNASASFDLIQCDLLGPCKVACSCVVHYFMTIMDDYSRAVWLFLLVEK